MVVPSAGDKELVQGKAPPEPDSALIVRVEPLAPPPLPGLHELTGPDATPRRLGTSFLVNIVERVAAIRILGAEVAGCGVTDLWCRNWISSCK